jgi:transposase
VVARILGVLPTSIHRWRRMARQTHGLDAKPLPGPTPRLSDHQLGQLEQLLLQGAKSHGWHNELWTADRVTRLIRERFGVCYHPEHVRKILKGRLHWTSQKPKRKAANATTRRSNAGRPMSYPASSAKLGSARRMSCSSTNRASA